MNGNKGKNLRERLRFDTRGSHENLDGKISRFDLTTPNGFKNFLCMQSMALRSIEPDANCAASCDALQDLLERTESDLGKFGTTPPSVVREAEPLQAHAIDYVIAGSRLGTGVLRKRWMAAEDPRVRQADAYFSAPGYIGLWTSFCASAEAMPATGPCADRVVRDAVRIFRLYLECARAAESWAESGAETKAEPGSEPTKRTIHV